MAGWKIRIFCWKYIFKWSLFHPAMLVYQSARSSNGIHVIFSGGCPSDIRHYAKKNPLERIMPYYSRSLKGKSLISASFNHRPQPPATLESPLKTWRHLGSLGPEMNQRDLQIGMVVSLQIRNGGFKYQKFWA